MAYFAESVAMFAIAVGVALLLVGIGFLVLTTRLLQREQAGPRTSGVSAATPVTG
jgi:hypothetical protein